MSRQDRLNPPQIDDVLPEVPVDGDRLQIELVNSASIKSLQRRKRSYATAPAGDQRGANSPSWRRSYMKHAGARDRMFERQTVR